MPTSPLHRSITLAVAAATASSLFITPSTAEVAPQAAGTAKAEAAVFTAAARPGGADLIVNYVAGPVRAATAKEAQKAHRNTRTPQAKKAYLEGTKAGFSRTKEDAARQFGRGVHVVRNYDVLPTQVVHVDTLADAQALASHPVVRSVHLVEEAAPTLSESLSLIRQPEAAGSGHVGAGTSVAVLDTGVDYRNAAFGSCRVAGESCRVAFARDFAADDRKLDDNGHGTHVAAIAAAVAPQAKILSLDVFGKKGASDTDILAAVNWVVAHQSEYDIRAMNLSLGVANQHHTSECITSPYAGPFEQAAAVGVLPVVSAGNHAYTNGVYHSGVSYPACTPGAIRVGAVHDSDHGKFAVTEKGHQCTDTTTAPDKIACFSQSGSLLNVLAPGARITAAGAEKSGTSQAAPHVAGAAAVLASAYPDASAFDVASSIAYSGPGFTDPREDSSGGYLVFRRLDVVSALTTLRESLNARHVGNGVVSLGVNRLGNLVAARDSATIGLRFEATGGDALSPGCACEGWGVADAMSGLTAYANESAGTSTNLRSVSFSGTPTSATSIVQVTDALEVTHTYRPSSSPNLYEVAVTIRNIGATAHGAPRYRRVMDWDVPPTEFNEYVTLRGTGSPRILFLSDDGFASADPLSGQSSVIVSGDVDDSGPTDHGALFDFAFGALAPGESISLTLYYGAAGTEAEALAALSAVGATAFSLGQASTADGPSAGTPNTFIFGYKP